MDASQPDPVEGFLRAPLVALGLMSDQGSVRGQPTLSTFPVGGNRSTQRKPTTFGRALTESFHISLMSSLREATEARYSTEVHK